MSAWSQAVWIVNKVKNSFTISDEQLAKIKNDYDILKDRTTTKSIRKANEGEQQTFPTENIGIGTICFIYEDEEEDSISEGE